MPLSYWVYFGPMVLSKYTGLGASSGPKVMGFRSYFGPFVLSVFKYTGLGANSCP